MDSACQQSVVQADGGSLTALVCSVLCKGTQIKLDSVLTAVTCIVLVADYTTLPLLCADNMEVSTDF